MTTYNKIEGGVARVPRNYVNQVNKSIYDGDAKLGELVVDMADPAKPALYIGNVTGDLAPVLTGTQSNANITNLFSNTIISNVGNIITINSNVVNSNVVNSNVVNSNILNANIANIVDLNVSNNVNFTNSPNVALGPVSNIHITGGSPLMVLTTDGNGNLSWTYKVAIGDIKQSLKTTDHDGWFKMDGRSVAGLSLTVSQQLAAAGLGLTTLPDATNRLLKQKGGTIGSDGGQNTVTITAANLPSTGLATSTAGDHNHVFFPEAVRSGYAAVESGGDFVKLVGPSPEWRTGTGGAHNHNLTGGNDVPLNIESAWIDVNAFVFLGT